MARSGRTRAKRKSVPAVRSEEASAAPGSVPHMPVEERHTWLGPLPPPEALKAFREAVPRSDEVILSEFERQGSHRRSVETRESKANAFAVKALSAGTMLTSVATVAGGILLAALGHTWGAGIVIAGPLVTVLLGRLSAKE